MKNKILFSFLAIAMLAMFIAPSAANAQQRNMTIVTNHPDFSVKVKRCAASGKTVIIDFILENTGTNDVNIDLGFYAQGKAWDDQGNVYSLTYRFANQKGYSLEDRGNALIAGVPTKMSVKIEDVPIDAEYISKIIVDIKCDDWALERKGVSIRNIPITRQ